MNAPIYTIEVLRLAASLPDPEPMERADGRAEERSQTCGSTVATQVKLDGDRRVVELAQQVHACAFGQAAAALVARHAPGQGVAEIDQAIAQMRGWLDGSTAEVPAWPEIGILAPARSRKSRHDAMLLPFRALQAAMKAART